MGSTLPSKAVRMFLSCSDCEIDQNLLQELIKQLSSLRRRGIIENWHPRMIGAGEEWKGQVDEHLKTADIILLLVSPDFINSDYCWDIEVRQAMERHEVGEARVIPILLRPVSGWQETPFGQLMPCPREKGAVTQWSNRDEALCCISEEIRGVVEEIVQKIAEEEARKRKIEELKRAAEARKKNYS